MSESGGTLIDNGYESGTTGNALTVGTLTTNGGSIQYSTTSVAEGSKSARCLANGPTFGTQLDYSFSTTGELRFWHNPTLLTKSCNIFDLPGDSTSTLLILWDEADDTIKWYNQRAVSGLSATTYYAIGTYTTGWTQYRIVPDYSAHTCKVFQRTSLSSAWTQLSISSPAVSDLPMRSSSISSMPGMSFSAYNGQTLYLDSVKYGSIVDQWTTTYTADAIIANQPAIKTYTADALVGQEWPLTLTLATAATYTADAVIVDRTVTKTYTADAIVQAYDWYDVTVTSRLTKTYTADAVIAASGSAAQTKTYTADAVIYAPPYAVTYTADAIVKGLGLLKTYTADAVVTDASSQSTALSWFFRRRRSSMTPQTKTYTVVQAKGTTRTATWTSPTYLSKTEAGIIVVLDVTAASGTGGLTLRINAQDSAGSVSVPLNSAPTAVTATGTTSYALYPFGAISGALTQSTSGYLPREFSISVTHGDSSSYTYSVGYCLLP